MAEESNPLNAHIKRLLQVTAQNNGDTSAEARQRNDRRRLQQLSVATTSVDTLVIVRFPPGNFLDCDGYKWETKEFLMDSQQMLATGSSVFAAQLSPEGQAQTRRLLDYDPASYPGVNYVMDLTPPIEGVESASLVARMSLSNGVRDWWRSCYLSGISKCLVSGHDDVCPRHVDLFLSGYNSKYDPYSPMGSKKLEYPEPRRIADYCPIRHRAATLRLLMAIRQGDLVLDSAPRTATMIVIAKYFDCARVVKDSVLTWFMSDPNQEFIHVNTEDALCMSWMVELRSVARMAFRVLVVERAAEILDNKRVVNNNKGQPSIVGRTRGRVTDEQETCIQHAAQKLAQRANSLYAQLISCDVNIHLGITTWPASSQDLCQALRTYIRELVHDAMVETHNTDDDIDSIIGECDRSRARYVPAADYVSAKDIYLGLSPPQRILTCAFWRRFSALAGAPEKLHDHVSLEITELPQPPDEKEPEAQQSPIMFDREAFHCQFLAAILDLRGKWMDDEPESNMSKNSFFILGLSDTEFKFLPIWAGGLEDGTGGVYQPEIPDAERGFPIGPGPGFYTGESIPDDRSSTMTDGRRTPTIFPGADTMTMTSGHSIIPAYSQMTGLDDELATAAGAQLTTASPTIQEEGATISQASQMAPNACDMFDWTDGASGDPGSHSDDDLDFDIDESSPNKDMED
ncbi:hypothetical protein F4803DRAFT_545899 [Xylaria telfairii]|nr:hypothetical protein F4803DRAFT_545899 [Xylaria telfairii]